MKSLLFSAPMVPPTLAGLKWVTRRLPNAFTRNLKPGDLVYGKEAWRAPVAWDYCKPRNMEWETPIQWDADKHSDIAYMHVSWGRLRSPIHMPEWASRIRLRIVSVREEPLMDITDEDAIAEGIEPVLSAGPWAYRNYMPGSGSGPLTPRASFASLWDSIHGKGALKTNPTVARIQFEKVTP